MEQGKIHIFTGDGRGKSSAAVGCAMQAACSGKETVIIQFLKGKGLEDSAFVKRLEPEIKLFRFEKSEADFNELSEEEKAEAILSIRNGMNFARKVSSTGGYSPYSVAAYGNGVREVVLVGRTRSKARVNGSVRMRHTADLCLK